MEAHLYSTVYFLSMTILCMLVGVRYAMSQGNLLYIRGNKNKIVPILISLVLILWLGGRPFLGGQFGDTANYAFEYVNYDIVSTGIDWHREWLWQWIMATCQRMGLTVHDFFTVIEAGYIGTSLIATFILVPRNPLLGFLFVVDSLMFFSFGTNGLRNGLACNTLLLAFACMFSGRRVFAALLCLAAFGIHRSTILPIAGVLAAITFFKKPQYAIWFWLLSIVLSLLVGETITNFFANLGFDDRMTAYTDNRYDDLSESRFRWDFLLYSSLPIMLGWYICVRRKISENWYNALFITYCLANSFWVMVIRSNFSNRFAYLSWFIYPFLIAYPLIMMPTWKYDQDRRTGSMLMGYTLFTLLMQVLWGNINF